MVAYERTKLSSAEKRELDGWASRGAPRALCEQIGQRDEARK